MTPDRPPAPETAGPPPPPPARVLLTEAEAADYLRGRVGGKFSRYMVQERRLKGQLAGVRVGGAWRYPTTALDRYIDALVTAAVAATSPSRVRGA